LFYSYDDSQDENVFQHLPLPNDPSVSNLKITDDIDSSHIPYTYGEFYRIRNEEVNRNGLEKKIDYLRRFVVLALLSYIFS